MATVAATWMSVRFCRGAYAYAAVSGAASDQAADVRLPARCRHDEADDQVDHDQADDLLGSLGRIRLASTNHAPNRPKMAPDAPSAGVVGAAIR